MGGMFACGSAHNIPKEPISFRESVLALYKRMIGVYCCMAVLLTVCLFRVYAINVSDSLTMAADVQSRQALVVSTTRGTIYDRSMVPLVNSSSKYIASVLPTPQAAGVLLPALEEKQRPAVLNMLTAGSPFALEVPTNDLYALGVDVFRVSQRYSQNPQLAPHIIGYLNGQEQTGAAGIEKAFDSLLKKSGGQIVARYQVDAMGRSMENGAVQIDRSGENDRGGVVLTLDASMQAATQSALEKGCEKGAVVVMDIGTGDILAMASVPDFDPGNIAASLESKDAPFINRAISGYNIGSVFKVIVSAAALENGITPDFSYTCQGSIDVDGQVFRCNNHAIHGTVDMERALEVSCNTYFINLALTLGPDYIPALSSYMGLGSASELAEGFTTQSGNLPTRQELSNRASLANFGFGQGSSLATPLQMAQAISAIANSGMAVTPRLVMGETEDGSSLSVSYPSYSPNRILSENTAKTVQGLMVKVIEEGSGRKARPITGGAGGKTSSAQTGIYDENGKEIVHAWFAGFFPAAKPKYAAVVFVEGGESGENAAGPIFKQVADGIIGLDLAAGSSKTLGLSSAEKTVPIP